MWSEGRVELLFANPCPGHCPCWPCGNFVPVQPDGICEISHLRKNKKQNKEQPYNLYSHSNIFNILPISFIVCAHTWWLLSTDLSLSPHTHTHTHTRTHTHTHTHTHTLRGNHVPLSMGRPGPLLLNSLVCAS